MIGQAQLAVNTVLRLMMAVYANMMVIVCDYRRHRLNIGGTRCIGQGDFYAGRSQ